MDKPHVVLIAGAMFLGGLGLIGYQLFVLGRWHGLVIMSEGALMIVGGMWLWEDCILPLLGKKDDE